MPVLMKTWHAQAHPHAHSCTNTARTTRLKRRDITGRHARHRPALLLHDTCARAAESMFSAGSSFLMSCRPCQQTTATLTLIGRVRCAHLSPDPLAHTRCRGRSAAGLWFAKPPKPSFHTICRWCLQATSQENRATMCTRGCYFVRVDEVLAHEQAFCARGIAQTKKCTFRLG